MQELKAFIADLPKVELHVHHVGSASPRIVAELAARHEGTSPVPADPDRLREYFEFRDLAHFIEIYLSVVDLIRTPDDVAMLTYEIAREMSGQSVRYAELTVTPYTSIIRGIAAEEFCAALEDAPTAPRCASKAPTATGMPAFNPVFFAHSAVKPPTGRSME